MSIVIHDSKKTLNRVLILIPSPYFFYFNQGLALRQAFANENIDSLLLVDNINDNSMLSILSAYKPDIIFSINSYKRPLMEHFPEILHIRWIHDNQFDTVDFRKETSHPLSNISYSVTTRQQDIIKSPAKNFSGILRFAATPATTETTGREISAFSLVGYIPPANLLDTRFEVNKENSFTGWNYLNFLDQILGESIDFPLEQLDQIVQVFLHSQGTTPQNAPEELLRLFREEFIRASNRSRLVKKILSLGKGCRIYGMQEWTTWPEFAPHYNGPLSTTDENYEVFRSTSLNIHNGGTISHPRVFECMAAFGGPLLANRIQQPDKSLNLEPGVHYIEYDLADFEDVTNELLANPTLRRKISHAAFKLTSEHHTWNHRVSQVLSDISEYC